jgi:membrane protein implicated in regulation of membrane protease activity
MMTIAGFTLEAPWWWMIAAVVLAVAEILAPGFFLIWLAAAALVTGFLALLIGFGIAAQLGLFAILAIGAIYGARRWLRSNPILSSDPLLNERTSRMIGDSVEVVEAIVGGSGRVRVGDGAWNASGPDTPIGTRVRIIGAEGTLLKVEPI